MQDIKKEYRNFCMDNMEKIRSVQLPKISKHKWTKKEAVIVEFRIYPHLEFVIRNTINKLGPTWAHTVICGNLNFNMMQIICNKINNEMIEKYGIHVGQIRLIKIEADNFIVAQYSLFIASLEFWNLLTGEKILIYQDDTCIFNDNIDDFLECDYIGAQFPTNMYSGTYVGNGGLSLRTKNVMIDVINKQNIMNVEMDMEYDEIKKQYATTQKLIIPEDVYFCKMMYEHNIGKLADIIEANKFSVESCYDPTVVPFGGHCFWNVLPDWKQYIIEKVLIK